MILAWVGLFLLFIHRRRAGMICLSVSLGAFAIITVLPVGDLLLAPLENRFPEITTLPAHVDGVIVLGGAIDPEMSKARGQPALNAAAERMTQFLMLAHHYPQARLAFTGGNGRLIHGDVSEAQAAEQLFTQLGLDRARVVYESRSRTTYENAVFLKTALSPKPGEVWLLVTSAWHMPRSVGLFRSAGWSVVPYPVGYKTAPGFTNEAQGSLPDRLGMIDIAAHEWTGLLAYWALGRTDALFPSPQGTTPR